MIPHPAVKILQIADPRKPYTVLTPKLPIADSDVFLRIVAVPGIADTEHDLKIILLCRVHEAGKLCIGIGIHIPAFQVRLELPPRDDEHDGVKAVLPDLPEILVRHVHFAAPEIDGKIAACVGRRFRESAEHQPGYCCEENCREAAGYFFMIHGYVLFQSFSEPAIQCRAGLP